MLASAFDLPFVAVPGRTWDKAVDAGLNEEPTRVGDVTGGLISMTSDSSSSSVARLSPPVMSSSSGLLTGDNDTFSNKVERDRSWDPVVIRVDDEDAPLPVVGSVLPETNFGDGGGPFADPDDAVD